MSQIICRRCRKSPVRFNPVWSMAIQYEYCLPCAKILRLAVDGDVVWEPEGFDEFYSIVKAGTLIKVK